MPVLRPSGSDFTSFVKAAAQYVPAGGGGKVSKSGGVPVALPGLGAIIRTSQVGALASPTTSAVVINGVTPRPQPPPGPAGRVYLGAVTTLAGQTTAGSADGTGALASFNVPFGLAVIPSSGVIVVADVNNHRIRLVTPGGVVSTLAGGGGGYADGTGAAASFNNPWGVAVIPSSGVIVVADTYNNRIRLVTPLGVVTTLAGGGGGYADGTGAAASFNHPNGVAVTPTGDVIVVADFGNQRIRLVTYPGGVVTTLAGQGTRGSADGIGTGATFSSPIGVAVLPNGNIVVADGGNHCIRLVTNPGGLVTTLAGGTQGFADGTGAGAQFYGPHGVTALPNGNIVVSDTANHRVRLVTQAGVVTTLAGSGAVSFADGTGTAARFSSPSGVAVIPSSGMIVVADMYNNRIRLIV